MFKQLGWRLPSCFANLRCQCCIYFACFLLGEVLPGWDVAVATMKKGELARLLIKSAYAYGEFGCPPRIPPKATGKCVHTNRYLAVLVSRSTCFGWRVN